MSASGTQKTLQQSTGFGTSTLTGNRVLANRYEVQRKLGSGNFGTAYLVKDLKADASSKEEWKVAKQMSVGDIAPDETLESIKEGRLLSKLNHPGIVKFYDSFFDNEMFCIVTEFCEGGDLKTKIAEAKKKNNYFEEAVVVDWFVQLMLAVEYIHNRRILHRDLTTGNVFLRNGMVKLGDFGISRVLMGTLDMASTFTGTPYYMSPEVLKHDGYNSKSDMWSVGCILYELCTLNHAFEGQGLMGVMYKIVEGDIPKLPDRYSPKLNEVYQRILTRDIHKRPSASEVLQIPFMSSQIERLKSQIETTNSDAAVNRKISNEQLEKEARDISNLINEPAHLEDLKRSMGFGDKMPTSENVPEVSTGNDATIKGKRAGGTVKAPSTTVKADPNTTVKAPPKTETKPETPPKPTSGVRKGPTPVVRGKAPPGRAAGPVLAAKAPRLKSSQGRQPSGVARSAQPEVAKTRQPNAEEIAAAEAEFMRTLKQTRESGAFKATYQTSDELKRPQPVLDEYGTIQAGSRGGSADQRRRIQEAEEEEYRMAVEAEKTVGLNNLSPKQHMLLRKRRDADEKAHALKHVTQQNYLTQKAMKEDIRDTMLRNVHRKSVSLSPESSDNVVEYTVEIPDDDKQFRTRTIGDGAARRDDRPITPMKKDLYKEASKELEFQHGIPVNPQIADMYYSYYDEFEDSEDSGGHHHPHHDAPLVSQSFNPRGGSFTTKTQRIRFVSQDGGQYEEEFGRNDERTELANYMATILTRPSLPQRSMTFVDDEPTHRDAFGPQARQSKIKVMRADCERKLGPVKFRQVYDYLKDARSSSSNNNDNNEQRINNDLRRMLGNPHDAFLVDQLLFLETMHH